MLALGTSIPVCYSILSIPASPVTLCATLQSVALFPVAATGVAWLLVLVLDAVLGVLAGVI